MSAYNRIRAIALLVHDRGLSRDAAEVIALALFPFDTGPEGVTVSRRFPKKIAKHTKRFRNTARSQAGNVLVDLARKTIEDYYDVAVSHRETYYIAKFENSIAGPAPWVGEASGPESIEELLDAGEEAEELVDGGEEPEELVDGGEEPEELVDGGEEAEDLVDGGEEAEELPDAEEVPEP